MTWEEHLEWLNESTIEEIEAEIAKIAKETDEAANSAMNAIHWILQYSNSKTKKLELISEENKKYNKIHQSAIRPLRDKRMKQNYTKDPENYEKAWHELHDFSEKVRNDMKK